MITQNIHGVDKVKISVKSYKGSSWVEIAHYDAEGNIMLELAVFGNDSSVPLIAIGESVIIAWDHWQEMIKTMKKDNIQ